MGVDPGILAACISGVVAVVTGGVVIFSKQRAMETKIDANHQHAETQFEGVKDRLDLMEMDLGKIDHLTAAVAKVDSNVSYIRGYMDAESKVGRRARSAS